MRRLTPLVLSLLLGCGSTSTAPGSDSLAPLVPPDPTRIPLTDLGTGTYRGFMGSLYPNGSNQMPATHFARGLAQARLIRPLDVNGLPSAGGKYVLLSIGMSNTTQSFCAEQGTVCNAWSFSGQAAADPAVNHTTLALANGAKGGQNAEHWDDPAESNYDRVRDSVLVPARLSEAQVQIARLKAVLRAPTVSLPAANADAYALKQIEARVVRALKTRYPNLRQIFLSSRGYSGFATITLHPEPDAYETGFAMKWLIEAQIRQLDSGFVDSDAGDLGPPRAPWLAWGAYLWAGDAAHPRADGLFWIRGDYEGDGTHPSTSGEYKIGRQLLQFFKSSTDEVLVPGWPIVLSSQTTDAIAGSPRIRYQLSEWRIDGGADGDVRATGLPRDRRHLVR